MQNLERWRPDPTRNLKQMEQKRYLAATGAQSGWDSSEYEAVGETRQSGRKKPVRKGTGGSGGSAPSRRANQLIQPDVSIGSLSSCFLASNLGCDSLGAG